MISNQSVIAKLSQHDLFMLLNVPLFIHKLTSKVKTQSVESVDDGISINSSSNTTSDQQSDLNLPREDNLNSTAVKKHDETSRSRGEIQAGHFGHQSLPSPISSNIYDFSFDDSNINASTISTIKKIVQAAVCPIVENVKSLQFTTEKLAKIIELSPGKRPLGVWLPTRFLSTERRPKEDELKDSVLLRTKKKKVPALLKDDSPEPSTVYEGEGTGIFADFEPRLWHKIEEGHGRRWFVSLKELKAAKSHNGGDISFLLDKVFGEKYVQNHFYFEFFSSDLEKATNQLLCTYFYYLFIYFLFKTNFNSHLVLYGKTLLPKGASTYSKEFIKIVKNLRNRFGRVLENNRPTHGIHSVADARAVLKFPSFEKERKSKSDIQQKSSGNSSSSHNGSISKASKRKKETKVSTKEPSKKICRRTSLTGPNGKKDSKKTSDIEDEDEEGTEKDDSEEDNFDVDDSDDSEEDHSDEDSSHVFSEDSEIY